MTIEQKHTVASCLPFALWIGLMSFLPATAMGYAVRSGITLVAGIFGLFLVGFKSFSFPSIKDFSKSFFIGLIVGILVTIIWIYPESFDLYRKWLCWPIGSIPEIPSTPSPYSPAVCGWSLTILKLIGSAFIIAPVEEVFFRSFLYRRLQSRDFLTIPQSRFDSSAFLWMIFLFALEHDRFFVAAIAGAAYGIIAIRYGLASAIIAHIVTNLLLALYVIHTGQWYFW